MVKLNSKLLALIVVLQAKREFEVARLDLLGLYREDWLEHVRDYFNSEIDEEVFEAAGVMRTEQVMLACLEFVVDDEIGRCPPDELDIYRFWTLQ